jgi:hypothetical protein
MELPRISPQAQRSEIFSFSGTPRVIRDIDIRVIRVIIN